MLCPSAVTRDKQEQLKKQGDTRWVPFLPLVALLCHSPGKKTPYVGMGLPQSCGGSGGKGVRWETL